jgi:hypothetical protein
MTLMTRGAIFDWVHASEDPLASGQRYDDAAGSLGHRQYVTSLASWNSIVQVDADTSVLGSGDDPSRRIQEVHRPYHLSLIDSIQRGLKTAYVSGEHLVQNTVLDHLTSLRGEDREIRYRPRAVTPIFDGRKAPQDQDERQHNTERDLYPQAAL